MVSIPGRADRIHEADSKNAAGWAVPARGARRIHAPAPAEAGHHERAEYGVPDNVGADSRQMRADSDAQGGARRDNADGLPQQPGAGCADADHAAKALPRGVCVAASS